MGFCGRSIWEPLGSEAARWCVGCGRSRLEGLCRMVGFRVKTGKVLLYRCICRMVN